mmetsp:Transcript_1885/g.4319  ORF Transcript_1885/g.4319 Transcript_1885/m.4319 type:complete len:80 (+) Transcript_1885:166-405(+)
MFALLHAHYFEEGGKNGSSRYKDMYDKWEKIAGCSDSTNRCLSDLHGHHTAFGKSFGDQEYRGDGQGHLIGDSLNYAGQ